VTGLWAGVYQVRVRTQGGSTSLLVSWQSGVLSSWPLTLYCEGSEWVQL